MSDNKLKRVLCLFLAMLFIFFELSSVVLAVSESDIKVNNIENNTNVVEEKIDKGEEVLEEDKGVLEEDKEKEEAKSKIESLKRALEDKLKVDRENKEEKDKKEDSDKQDKNVCTITFEPNGGSGEMKSVEVEYGKNYTLPKNEFKSPKGKEFSRWIFNEEELLPDDVVKITKDVVLKAVWNDVVSKGAGENVLSKEEALKFSKEVIPEPVQADPGKNVVDKYQIDEVEVVDAKTGLPATLDSDYIIKIKFSNIEKLKAGDVFKIDGYFPELYNKNTGKTYINKWFILLGHGYNPTFETDVTTKTTNGEDIVIGHMVGNKITFNENVEKLEKVNVDVGLGITNRMYSQLNVDPKTRKEIYNIPFYLTINNQTLKKPYNQIVKPDNTPNLTPGTDNCPFVRVDSIPSKEKPSRVMFFLNPYELITRSRDNGSYGTDKFRVEMDLPKSLYFKENIGSETEFKSKEIESNSGIVVSDDHSVNYFLKQTTGMFSGTKKEINDKQIIANFVLNRKPFGKNEGSHDSSSLYGIAYLEDPTFIDWKTGKIREPFVFRYYLNDELIETKEISSTEITVAANTLDSSGLLEATPTKTDINAKVKLINGEDVEQTLTDKQFNFVLKDKDGKEIQEASSDAKGNISFKDIVLTAKEVGDNKYTIEQVSGTDTKINYDTHVEEVNINVAKDEQNVLTAKVTYDKDGPIFINKSKIIFEYPVTGLNHSIYTLVALLIILSIGLYTSKSKSKH